MRPTISGEICIFDNEGKPVLSLVKGGSGEWHVDLFTEAGLCERRELRHGVSDELARFMAYHATRMEQ